MKRILILTGLVLASASFSKQANATTADRETLCLAKVIYYEDRSGTLKGKIMHAQVVLNRLKLASVEYGKTVCEVVFKRNRLKKNGSFRLVAEFPWIDHQQKEIKEPMAWQDAMNIASAVLDPESTIPDYSRGSIYFQDKNIGRKPEKSAIRVAEADRTIFYAMPLQVAALP